MHDVASLRACVYCVRKASRTNEPGDWLDGKAEIKKALSNSLGLELGDGAEHHRTLHADCLLSLNHILPPSPHVHQKPSSVKAAKSHLRTHIRKHIENVLLHELTPQVQQNFVTLLSQKGVSKTVLNVLGILNSMMGTAKAWGYCTQAITTSELALPAEEVRKQTRFFNGEEARKFITAAPEPYRTMFAIAATTGLRAGEVVGLQRADLDFDRRVIHVRRSAWYG